MKTAAFLALLLLLPSGLRAEAPGTCGARYEVWSSDFEKGLSNLELSYQRYRWAEFKIRRLLYERLWQARSDANHPLDKSRRISGSAEEERLMDILRDYRAQSDEASASFWKTLSELDSSSGAFPQMCERPDFIACMNQGFNPLHRKIEESRAFFRVLVENEREYRTAVENASGGSDGRYPQDLIEPAPDHTDFYWRFESSNSQARFTDDARMMELLLDLQSLLKNNPPAARCCLQCA